MRHSLDRLSERGRARLFFAGALAACLVVVWWTFTRAHALSGFAAGLLKWILALGVFYLFDAFVLRSLDTVEELRKGNMAYAVFLLAVAVIAAACLSTA